MRKLIILCSALTLTGWTAAQSQSLTQPSITYWTPRGPQVWRSGVGASGLTAPSTTYWTPRGLFFYNADGSRSYVVQLPNGKYAIRTPDGRWWITR
jgi:hypothetical protein